MPQRKTNNVIITWNEQPVAAGRIHHAVGKTLKKVENSIRHGIRFGAQDNIQDGKKAAQEILRLHDAMGPRQKLWNSIRSEQKGKNRFWLIAGTGMGADERYPLYIEKGFYPHFVPISIPSFRQWLEYKAKPEVLAYAKERGGLVVGKDPKWRNGIGYMEGAFRIMKNNLPTNLKNEIIKNLKKMKFRR